MNPVFTGKLAESYSPDEQPPKTLLIKIRRITPCFFIRDFFMPVSEF